MISDIIRKKISQQFTGEKEIKFQSIVPSDIIIAKNLEELNSIGL